MRPYAFTVRTPQSTPWPSSFAHLQSMPPAVTPPPASARVRAWPSTPAPAFPKTRPTPTTKTPPSPISLDWGTAPSSSRATPWPCSSTTVATPTAKPKSLTAASGSPPSSTSPPALKSPTTTAFTTAATTKPYATAAHASAAEPCIRLKKSAAGNAPRKPQTA